MAPGKKWLKLGLFSFFSLFLTLAVLEIGFRLVAPQDLIQPMMAQIDPELIYTLTPNHTAHLKGTSSHMYHLAINRLGLRERDIAAHKPPGAFRILLLGDSVSMGEGVEQDETYIQQLERRLQGKVSARIETINAATRGYGTDQELILFRRLGRTFNPDLVILAFFLGNDFDDNWEGQLFKTENGVLAQQTPTAQTSPKFKYYTLQSRSQNMFGYGFLMAHSHLANWLRIRCARLIYRHVFSATPNAAAGAPQENQARFQLTLAILDEWNKAVRQAGARPFILIIPKRADIEALRAAPPGDPLCLDRIVEQFCRSAQVPFLNLTGLLRKWPADLTPLYLENGCAYFSPAGHAVVAQALADALRTEVKLEK